MDSCPLNKRERQGMSFAFVGWTARETAIQASEFAPVRWTRFAPDQWTGARKRPETADLGLVRSRSKEPKAVRGHRGIFPKEHSKEVRELVRQVGCPQTRHCGRLTDGI